MCIAAPTWNGCSPDCWAIWACDTFGDLRTGEKSEQFAWSLVVTASDLSRRRLVRIPWDLPDYGMDPDDFPVARAVHASAAIPYVFEPVRVAGATWVDGGLLSDFPVQLFDEPDGRPRWPTFGIRLSARPGIPPTHPVHGPVSLGIATIETLMSNQDNAYIDDPCTVRRTIFVPANEVSPIDFNLSVQQREALYQSGVQAGRQFLTDMGLRGLSGGLRRHGERRAAAAPDPAVRPAYRARRGAGRGGVAHARGQAGNGNVADSGVFHADINGADRPELTSA